MLTRFAAVLPLSLVLLATLGCEEKAPPPVPGGGSAVGANPDPARAARQVRDMVRNTQGAIEEGQQRAVDAANDIQGGGGTDAGKQFGLAGVEFILQPGWTALKPTSEMRKAELLYKGSAGEVTAIFFTLGGTADDNLNRWARQVETADGAKPSITSESIGDLTVKRIDARGTYQGMTATGANTGRLPNHRFIGAVVEGGRGPIQIRLVGPEQSVNEAAASFDTMLRNMRRS